MSFQANYPGICGQCDQPFAATQLGLFEVSA